MIIKSSKDIVIPDISPSEYAIFERSDVDISGKVVSSPLLRVCLVNNDNKGLYTLYQPQVFLYSILEFMQRNNLSWLKK